MVRIKKVGLFILLFCILVGLTGCYYVFDHRVAITSDYYSVNDVYGYYDWTSIPSPVSGYNAYCSTNGGKASSYSAMKVTISQGGSFSFYIRSSAESDYDYVIVSKRNAGAIPTDATSINAYKSAKTSNTGTSLSSYTQVSFSKVSAGDYFYIVFKKDYWNNVGEDMGYVLLPK